MSVTMGAAGVGKYEDCQCGGKLYANEENDCDLCFGSGKVWVTEAPEFNWTNSNFAFVFNVVLGYNLSCMGGQIPSEAIPELRKRIIRTLNRPTFPGASDMPRERLEERLRTVDKLASWAQTNGKSLAWS